MRDYVFLFHEPFGSSRYRVLLVRLCAWLAGNLVGPVKPHLADLTLRFLRHGLGKLLSRMAVRGGYIVRVSINADIY